MRKFAVSLSVAAVVLAGSVASAQKTPVVPHQPAEVSGGFFSTFHISAEHTEYNRLSAATNAAASQQDPRIVSIPNFTRSFSYGGNSYSYTMVGQQPSQKKTTTVPTSYVPLSFYFDEFVDKSGNNIVIDATTISSEIKKSPLFESADYATGYTQFGDAQMRAEFFPLFNKDSDNDANDNFHVLLGKPHDLIAVTIEVPVGSANMYQLPDGSYVAVIDINFLVSQLNTLLQTEPISVTSIPIFLTRNAVYGDFSKGQWVDCCIGGFHSAVEVSQTKDKTLVQVFDFATSLDSDVANFVFGDPGVFADVNALSHEIAETLNDPFANNITPKYQLPGAPAGACQNILEVGDVIENLNPDYTEMTMNGFTYHPQTEALLQWFEGKKPSNAVNGYYSFPDPTRLTAPFTPCPTK